jgi:1,4-dihydroxy-2-naphthoate octaprenyltransferase
MTASADRVSLAAALSRTPVLTASQWRRTSPFVRYLIAVRAPVLAMTCAAAALGGASAWWRGRIDAAAWTVCTIGLLLAHAANNLLNDLTDSLRGVDCGDYFRTRYGAHVLEHGLMSRTALTSLTAATGAAALAAGLWLTARSGPDVAWPLGAGAFLLLFYTYPLKQLGLGELAVWLAWGPLMVGGTDLVASHAWHWSAAWLGAAAGLLPTTVIFGKHLDKLHFDAVRGIGTLPVRLGAVRSRQLVVAMSVAPYAAVAALAGTDVLPWTAALVLFALPTGSRAIRAFRREPPPQRPPDYPAEVWPLWYAAYAFAHARRFGALLLASFVAAWTLRAL